MPVLDTMNLMHYPMSKIFAVCETHTREHFEIVNARVLCHFRYLFSLLQYCSICESGNTLLGVTIADRSSYFGTFVFTL